MEAKATSKYVRMSPRKLRRVAVLIKGRDYMDARYILSYTPKAASRALMETMKSAAANAISREGSAKMKVENFYVKDIQIDGGPILKRIRPVGMGRAYRIRKRTAHIKIVLAEKSSASKILAKED
ncbi:MAG: 50S ribosomal protein L22 [candidate division Zixibacteria bacterium 4484_95]|nr:MAG: 50S ribosomal protein L22 [candidate division Zixibacteria bacterium 4484_95]RKX18433.1 MAG: 50S ribosomal protein L22 [candidate division Zixibacteria bacterium]